MYRNRSKSPNQRIVKKRIHCAKVQRFLLLDRIEKNGQFSTTLKSEHVQHELNSDVPNIKKKYIFFAELNRAPLINLQSWYASTAL